MKIAPFATEQFYALYEFNTPHLLSVSDCETITIAELLDMAGLTLAELGAQRLGYTESQGDPALRELIAQTYDETVSADDIIILTTPEEGIFIALHTLLEPTDEAIVLTPAYDSLFNLAAHITPNVKEWRVRPTATGWDIDLDQLAALMSAKTKLLVMNFPHNPTGFLPTADQWQSILALARQHSVAVFSDEMYRGLELHGRAPLPSASEMYDQAISLTGLSKTYGLPGLRSGWLIAKDPATRAALINWKHYTSICPPGPSEFLAKTGLLARTQLWQRNRAIIEANLAEAEPFFARWSQLFKWRAPQAGSVALVEIATESATDYCHDLAQEVGILLLPGSCLGADDTFVRFGFGRNSFASALKQYDTLLNVTHNNN